MPIFSQHARVPSRMYNSTYDLYASRLITTDCFSSDTCDKLKFVQRILLKENNGMWPATLKFCQNASRLFKIGTQFSKCFCLYLCCYFVYMYICVIIYLYFCHRLTKLFTNPLGPSYRLNFAPAHSYTSPQSLIFTQTLSNIFCKPRSVCSNYRFSTFHWQIGRLDCDAACFLI